MHTNYAQYCADAADRDTLRLWSSREGMYVVYIIACDFFFATCFPPCLGLFTKKYF